VGRGFPLNCDFGNYFALFLGRYSAPFGPHAYRRGDEPVLEWFASRSSRAAVITGRNHHSVGFGVIIELSTGYPGYDSIIGVDNATIGAILKGKTDGELIGPFVLDQGLIALPRRRA
jgi:hypothetical protein